MRNRCYVCTLLILTAVLLAGCPGGTAIEGTVPVTGTVTYQGTPVDGATVSFGPVGEGGRAASGLTSSSGEFTLTTLNVGDGVLPGKYRVTVSKVETQVPQAEGETMDYQAAKPEVKHLVPEKYERAATSGLEAEVTVDGENRFTFDLQ